MVAIQLAVLEDLPTGVGKGEYWNSWSSYTTWQTGLGDGKSGSRRSSDMTNFCKKSPRFSVAQFSYLPGMGVLTVLLPPSKSFVDKNIIPIKLPWEKKVNAYQMWGGVYNSKSLWNTVFTGPISQGCPQAYVCLFANWYTYGQGFSEKR